MTAEGVQLVYRLHGCLPFRLTCFASPDIFFRETSQLPLSVIHFALFSLTIDLYLLLLRWFKECPFSECHLEQPASAADFQLVTRTTCWLEFDQIAGYDAVFQSHQNKSASRIYSTAVSGSGFSTVLFHSQSFLPFPNHCWIKPSPGIILFSVLFFPTFLSFWNIQQLFFFFRHGSYIGSMETQSKWISDRVGKRILILQ